MRASRLIELATVSTNRAGIEDETDPKGMFDNRSAFVRTRLGGSLHR